MDRHVALDRMTGYLPVSRPGRDGLPWQLSSWPLPGCSQDDKKKDKKDDKKDAGWGDSLVKWAVRFLSVNGCWFFFQARCLILS